jgi:hypothetical protein
MDVSQPVRRDRTIGLEVFSGRVVYERDQAVPEIAVDANKNVHTTITRLRDYVIANRSGDEQTLWFKNLDFQARPGNVVSILYGLQGGEPVFLGAKNHDNNLTHLNASGVNGWFRDVLALPPAVAMVTALGFTLATTVGHMSLWIALAGSAALFGGLLIPVRQRAQPYIAERTRIAEFLERLARPAQEGLPPMSDDARSIIYQQFNAPNHGHITQSNFGPPSFPAEELRELLRGRSEQRAVTSLEQELASPAPRRSRIVSAIDVLRGVEGGYDVVRIANEWWTNPHVQSWIAGLMNH